MFDYKLSSSLQPLEIGIDLKRKALNNTPHKYTPAAHFICTYIRRMHL